MTTGRIMKESGQVNIRDFKQADLGQVSDILVEAFKKKFEKIAQLPSDEMLGLLIDTGMIDSYPFPGYIVAEDDSGIVGVLILRWKGQEHPELKLEFVKTARKYGWLRLIRLLAGYWFIKPRPRKGVCYGERLAVRPDKRGSGIGTRLLEYGFEFAAQNGFKKLTLHVASTDVEAIRLYKEMGFKILKTEKSYITGWILGSRVWHYMGYGLNEDKH
jgi:ribosomal protein S18 acetylase RimI-like enzyme